MSADTEIETVASYTLFSKARNDGSKYFYSVPAGFQFVLMEGVPENGAHDKFRTFVDMAARSGPKFSLRIGPENDPDLI